ALDRIDATELILDHVRRDDVGLYLNAADVVLMTSEREGAPLTIKEALAVETPVVSVAVGDVPEVLTDLPGCAVVDAEPEALAAAVSAALEMPRDGRLRARAEEFGRRAVAGRVAAIYDTVLAGSS